MALRLRPHHARLWPQPGERTHGPEHRGVGEMVSRAADGGLARAAVSQLGDHTHGPEATVRDIMLRGGSAWPAGFAHAERAKSAGPPAPHELELRGNSSPWGATAVRTAHSRPSRPLWCDRRARPPGVRVACRDGVMQSKRVSVRSCTEACGLWRRRIAG